jgi:hypothetical protein
MALLLPLGGQATSIQNCLIGHWQATSIQNKSELWRLPDLPREEAESVTAWVFANALTWVGVVCGLWTKTINYSELCTTIFKPAVEANIGSLCVYLR